MKFCLYMICVIAAMFGACASGLAMLNLMAALDSPLLGAACAFTGIGVCFGIAHWAMSNAERSI